MICQENVNLTGKMALTGNNVSHANNKTKRRFLPNLNMVSLASEKLEKSFKLKVSASALRTVDKKGGLDLYLLSVDETLLSRNALKIKKDIETLEEVKENSLYYSDICLIF